MRYTLRQLEYFIAAGETGSITIASERIHISQPSISTAIAHLEKELGVQLFVRHHAQGLSLTRAGRDMLLEAKNLVAQAEGLYTKASEINGQVRGTLSVGCMVTLAPMLAPELSHSFRAAFPGTQIRHVEGNQEQLLEGLRRSEIDIAITYDLQLSDDIVFYPLVALPPHVLLAESHPLARQSALTLKKLQSEPLILLDLPISREYFIALFLKEGLSPSIATRSAHRSRPNYGCQWVRIHASEHQTSFPVCIGREKSCQGSPVGRASPNDNRKCNTEVGCSFPTCESVRSSLPFIHFRQLHPGHDSSQDRREQEKDRQNVGWF